MLAPAPGTGPGQIEDGEPELLRSGKGAFIPSSSKMISLTIGLTKCFTELTWNGLSHRRRKSASVISSARLQEQLYMCSR
jgi:hypothetical protein